MILVIWLLLALGVLYLAYRFLTRSKATSSEIYVGNLDYRVRGSQLHDVFSEYGKVKSVRLVKNHKTGRSKGFAFVSFEKPQEAQKALSISGKEIQGRTVIVRIAKAKAN